MKKIFKMVTALVMVLSLASGCGDTESSNTESAGDVSASEKAAVFTATITEVEDETEKTAGDSDYPACVMVDGIIYKDTGYIDSMLKCGNMDGEITSYVDKLPSENNQSNFGTGYGYQRSVEGQVVVFIDDECRIFRDIEIDDDSIPEQVKNFNAEVKEVRDDGTLLVSYVSMPEGFASMSEGDYIVSADNLRGEVSKGDIVTIWFNGSVRETDPAQIGVVYRIEKAGNMHYRTGRKSVS